VILGNMGNMSTFEVAHVAMVIHRLA
jgi:hypothetical protein